MVAIPSASPNTNSPIHWSNTSEKRHITASRDREIEVVITNSDSSPERRATLLGLLKPGAREVVIDPGRAVVVDRLSDADGVLSGQCEDAIGRWFK